MKIREILKKLVDDSAGCVCIEHKDGECPCSKDISQAEQAILKELEGMMPKESGQCLNPQGTPREYITREMAMDAQDPQLEGQIYKEETFERCGECITCITDQVLADLKSSLKKEGGRMSEELYCARCGDKTSHLNKCVGYYLCDDCYAEAERINDEEK